MRASYGTEWHLFQVRELRHFIGVLMSKFIITENDAAEIERKIQDFLSKKYSVDPIHVVVKADRQLHDNILRISGKVYNWAKVLRIHCKEDM